MINVADQLNIWLSTLSLSPLSSDEEEAITAWPATVADDQTCLVFSYLESTIELRVAENPFLSMPNFDLLNLPCGGGPPKDKAESYNRSFVIGWGVRN